MPLRLKSSVTPDLKPVPTAPASTAGPSLSRAICIASRARAITCAGVAGGPEADDPPLEAAFRELELGIGGSGGGGPFDVGLDFVIGRRPLTGWSGIPPTNTDEDAVVTANVLPGLSMTKDGDGDGDELLAFADATDLGNAAP